MKTPKEEKTARVGEIWEYICKISDRFMDEWFFADGDYDEESGEVILGSFNEERDKTFIELGGGREHINNKFYPYNYGFPTILLFDPNWKEIVDQTVKDATEKQVLYLAEKKRKNKEKLARYTVRKESIQNKIKPILTDDEWQWICNKLNWQK